VLLKPFEKQNLLQMVRQLSETDTARETTND
jgi:FixJ family two-component response regulator